MDKYTPIWLRSTILMALILFIAFSVSSIVNFGFADNITKNTVWIGGTLLSILTLITLFVTIYKGKRAEIKDLP